MTDPRIVLISIARSSSRAHRRFPRCAGRRASSSARGGPEPIVHSRAEVAVARRTELQSRSVATAREDISMEIFRFDRDERLIGAHGSIGLHATRIASGDGGVTVTCLAVRPGGAIGAHPATGDQLFLVIAGSGWVAGADGIATRSRPAKAPAGPRARFTPPAPTPASPLSRWRDPACGFLNRSAAERHRPSKQGCALLDFRQSISLLLS